MPIVYSKRQIDLKKGWVINLHQNQLLHIYFLREKGLLLKIVACSKYFGQ